MSGAGDRDELSAEVARRRAKSAVESLVTGCLFIAGGWVDPSSAEELDVFDPSTGLRVAAIADASADDLDRGVVAAANALAGGAWDSASPTDRSRILRDIAARIEAHAEELALIESLDVGKPLEDARSDVAYAIECFDYYASLAVGIEGSTRYLPGGLAIVRREPVGVVGIITPFNFPLALSSVKIASALAAGCTVVHKPSERAALSSLAFAGLTARADLPAGAYNVVTGGPATGNDLVAHRGVAKIVFTGSTKVGATVAAAASQTLKRLTMELGGKSANIICADADVERAIEQGHGAYTMNAGQYCEAGSRLLVESPAHDHVVEALAAEAGRTVVGDALDSSTQMGPLISDQAAERVEDLVRRGVASGAHVESGGSRVAGADGYLFPPTVISRAAAESEIAQAEIFGPVVTVIPFDGLDEAIALANGTRFGLAAGIQTADLGKGLRVAERLEAGTVWINDWATGSIAIPVGGRKQSGLGREQGPEGLSEFLEYKSILATLG